MQPIHSHYPDDAKQQMPGLAEIVAQTVKFDPQFVEVWLEVFDIELKLRSQVADVLLELRYQVVNGAQAGPQRPENVLRSLMSNK